MWLVVSSSFSNESCSSELWLVVASRIAAVALASVLALASSGFSTDCI